MPPSIILEVLKITEAEMELRDATREAEQAREALRLTKKIHNDDSHPEVIQAKTLLGSALSKKGAFAEAIPYVSEAFEAHKAAKRHGQMINVANTLGHVLRSAGKFSECEALLRAP